MNRQDAEVLLNEILSNAPQLTALETSKAFPEVISFDVEADLDVDFDFGSFMDLDNVSVTAEPLSVCVVPTTERIGGMQAVVWKIAMKSGVTVVLCGECYRRGDETNPVKFGGEVHVIEEPTIAEFFMLVEIAARTKGVYQRWAASAKDLVASLDDLLKTMPAERAEVVKKTAAAALQIA